MKTDSKKKRGYASIGFSSIFTIFLTICLVTFAALSILTANSDYKLTKKVAEKTSAYYTADSTAQETLEAIDSQLVLLYQNADSKEQYFASVTAEDLELPTELTSYEVSSSSEEGTQISFSVSISETQYLEVLLDVLYPSSESDVFFQIRSWRTRTIEQTPVEEPNLHLFTGETP